MQVTFEQKPEGKKVNHVDNWEKNPPSERSPSAKALRWEVCLGNRRKFIVSGVE